MGARILCVEDNSQNMNLIHYILQQHGFKVIEAFDGLSGVELAQTESPDLILMDINLPDIDGLEVVSRLKADPKLQSIPIIALTSNGMYGDEERALAAGCDGYIVKPVSRITLTNKIEQYLNIAD